MHIPQSLFSSMRFNFLYVDRYIFQGDWVYPESYVPYCMVRYITKGSAVFVIDGEKEEVHENQIAYIPEDCLLECYSLEKHFEFISIRFTTTAHLNGSDFLREYFGIPLLTDHVEPRVLGYFNQVFLSATSEAPSRLFLIRGNLELILAYLVDKVNEGKKEAEAQDQMVTLDPAEEAEAAVPDVFTLENLRRREKHSSDIKLDPRIQVVVDYLVAHPAAPFNSQYLSEIADMSQSSLRRLFKLHTGKTPGDFLKELRMATAARSLLTSNRRVSAIAYEVGFDDLNYFSRIFKATFGISPQAYRKASREQGVGKKKKTTED